MSWIFFCFFTYKIKISQQEFWLTNAKMWDLLTPSNCIRSPPFTPSSPPSHHPNSPHPGVGGGEGREQWQQRGGGGERFFWLNAAFANIKDYIVSAGVKYRHEMHQLQPPFTDSGLVRLRRCEENKPCQRLDSPASFCWIKASDVLKVLRTTPESSTWKQLTQSGSSPQDSSRIRIQKPNGHIYQPEHVNTN